MSPSIVLVGRTERSLRALPFIPNPRRHDLRSALPAQLQTVVQNGFLEQLFRNALVPDFLYPAVADSDPWQGRLGATRTSTRKGLLAPVTTPTTGSDSSVATYGFEQWSVSMDQYGNTVETDMLANVVELASQYLSDVQTLGTNAGQSINQIARNRLYRAYAGGRTWVATASGSSTTLAVADVAGFTTRNVNGQPQPVSASNALPVTVNGVANTVTGVSVQSGAGDLTLGTAAVGVVGQAVVAANAPVSLRAAGNTAYDLSGSNVATAALFRAAVSRLRKMNVPTVNGGNYVAHIDPDTEAQLFADADFKQAYQGRGDSAVFRDMSIGTFLGIDWVRNNEVPTVSPNGVTVHRPIVVGAGVLVNAPLQGQGQLLSETGVSTVPNISMINVAPGADVVLIVRPPQDNYQQKIRTTWSWTGDFGVPTDVLTGDSAQYKRGIVIEHG